MKATIKLLGWSALTLVWTVFYYWTLINAIMATEGGLQVRLIIIVVGIALVFLYTTGRSMYKAGQEARE